jgi:hypothetical protein
MTDSKPDIRILVDVKQENSGGWSGKYLKLRCDFVYMTDEGLRNGGSGHYNRDPLSGLTFTGQLDTGGSTDFYGQTLAYMDQYSVELADAELMVRTLRRVQRRVATLTEKFGQPADTAAHLALIANAAGATEKSCFGRRVSGNAWSYDGNEYRWMDADALRYHLDTKVREFIKENPPKDA